MRLATVSTTVTASFPGSIAKARVPSAERAMGGPRLLPPWGTGRLPSLAPVAGSMRVSRPPPPRLLRT
jgi:hypothetical protein